MSLRIFITGGADGLGLKAAQTLISKGHHVTLQARNPDRAATALSKAPGAKACLTGDLTSLSEITALAADAKSHGPYDVIIHNAGLGPGTKYSAANIEGGKTVPSTWAVNVLALYVLSALMDRPKRIIYMSSGLQHGGKLDLEGATAWNEGNWNAHQCYSDTKLWVVVFANAIKRRWQGTKSWAVDPGWVKTRMGGPNAELEQEDGVDTMCWLAEGNSEDDGDFWVRREREESRKEINDESVQEALLKKCEEWTGVKFE